MKILIACEHSGSIRSQFHAFGHDVTSVDLLPDNSGLPGLHITGDLSPALEQNWDLVIAFPPCQYLCNAQTWMCNKSSARRVLRSLAVDFVKMIWDSCDRVIIENPVGYLSSGFRPYSQLIRPCMFGDPYQKEICLWLKNMPFIISTCVNPIQKKINNHTNSRMSQSVRSEIRSSWTRYPLMARALANQWSSFLSHE